MSTGISLSYPTIANLAPYPAGKPLEAFKREYGIDDVIKLASNENALGFSPKVTQAITEEIAGIARYPDANGFYLKEALAKFHDLPISHFTLGNGSEELINLIARCFVSADDAVMFGQYSFIAYPMVTASQGATAIEVPAKDYGIDLDAMAKILTDNKSTKPIKVVFIANPNNPTGTMLNKKAVAEFMSKVPPSTLVVLDEAYVHFEPECDNQALLAQHKNLVILRTFSKAHGLAGVRVGYVMAHPDIHDVFNRVRQPFNVNRLAQVAAMASLADTDFIEKVTTTNNTQMAWLYTQFDALGLRYVPSHTNFVLLQVPNAQQVNESLLQQGVIIRPMDEYGLDDWIRVSIGTEAENQRFISSLTKILV